MSGPSIGRSTTSAVLDHQRRRQLEVGRHHGQCCVDAWVGVADGLVIDAVGRAVGRRRPTERIDAGGRCVMPGFVDSHTHLVFAGDRSDEFAARMAGAAVRAGGIRTTVAATRAAADEELRPALRRRLAEARRAGTTTIEIKSGYGLDVEPTRRASCASAGEVTAETTFLGAHVVPPEFDGRADDYVDAGVRRDAAGVRTARPLGRRLLRARSLRRRPVPRRADGRPRRRARPAAARQPTRPRSRACSWQSSWVRVGRPLHLPVATPTSTRWPASDTVATFLPATDFSTRQPYPDARRVIDAGAPVAIATNCNPGSSYTTSMPFCIALAVRDMRMTMDEAVGRRPSAVHGRTAPRRHRHVTRRAPAPTSSCSTRRFSGALRVPARRQRDRGRTGRRATSSVAGMSERVVGASKHGRREPHRRGVQPVRAGRSRPQPDARGLRRGCPRMTLSTTCRRRGSTPGPGWCATPSPRRGRGRDADAERVPATCSSNACCSTSTATTPATCTRR